MNLAFALTRVHTEARVAVADLALPGGDIRLLLNVRPSYDLGDIAEKIDRVDADLMHSVLAPATDGLWVLAAPERPEAEEIVDANVAATVVQQLKAAFNFSVLDCEHQLNDRTLAALDAADRIILLTELKVPANKRVQITVVNDDATPEEFESHEMKVEKVIPGKSKGVVRIGPLKPGRYPFFGEFHEATAKGTVIAE